MLDLLLHLVIHLELSKSFDVVFFVLISDFLSLAALTEFNLFSLTKELLVMRECEFHAFD